MIGITQPRRIAAISLAKRVAEERNCTLGSQVGFNIRFEECFVPGVTKIKYVTEGILVREMMGDPLLKSYSVIMIDEAHERTLYTDIVLGLLKKIIKKRPDLRLIVSSATLEAESMQKFFNFNKTGDKSKDTSTILRYLFHNKREKKGSNFIQIELLLFLNIFDVHISNVVALS